MLLNNLKDNELEILDTIKWVREGWDLAYDKYFTNEVISLGVIQCHYPGQNIDLISIKDIKATVKEMNLVYIVGVDNNGEECIVSLPYGVFRCTSKKSVYNYMDKEMKSYLNMLLQNECDKLIERAGRIKDIMRKH